MGAACGVWAGGAGVALAAPVGGFAAVGVELEGRLPPLGGVRVRLEGPDGAGAVLHEGLGGKRGARRLTRPMRLVWGDGGPAALRERAAVRAALGDAASDILGKGAVWRPQEPLWRVVRGMKRPDAANQSSAGKFSLKVEAFGAEADVVLEGWESGGRWKLVLCDTQYELMEQLGRGSGGGSAAAATEGVHAKSLPVPAAVGRAATGSGLGVAALEFAAAEAFAAVHHDAAAGVVAFKTLPEPGAPDPPPKTVLGHFPNPAGV